MDKSHYVNYRTLTKATNGKTKEEEELDKLKDIINRVKNYANNDLREHLQSKKYNSNRRSKSLHITKSNFQKNSSSKTREDRNDREFLTNFMNDDDYISIGARNMHLLSDDDTNQSITSREKFKKLSKLMLDDKEVVVENGFGMEEDKMILHLFTALSRKSKKVFIEEDPDKLSRLQVFFRRINAIKIPTIGPDLKEEEQKKDTPKEESELKEDDVCSFMKKNLPLITSELLSNINHHFITIEEIYNGEEIRREKRENDNNNSVVMFPITAEEVGKEKTRNSSSTEERKSKTDWDKNKFVEFNAHCPQSPFDLEPDKEAIKKINKENKRREKNIKKIIDLNDFSEEYFPENSENMPIELIYEIALRNKQNTETREESFTLSDQLQPPTVRNENSILSPLIQDEVKPNIEEIPPLTEEEKKEEIPQENKSVQEENKEESPNLTLQNQTISVHSEKDDNKEEEEASDEPSIDVIQSEHNSIENN